MRQAFETPWKVWNVLASWLAKPFVFVMFAFNGIAWGQGWRFFGLPVIQKHRRSSMRFGPRMELRSSLRSNPLGPNHPVFLTTWKPGATLQIGADFGMTGGVICAAEAITIGDRVIVGANSTIIDTDFHPLNAQKRQEDTRAGRTAPIIIEDDVFIGMHSLILKGVRLGAGCVIGAGSVVARDVPAGMIAAGNPAQVLGPVSR